MTGKQKVLLQRYARMLQKQSERIRRWRDRNPNYEKSDHRRAYKKAWAQAQRQKAALPNPQVALQP